MAKDNSNSNKINRRIKNLLLIFIILVVILGIPLIVIGLQTNRSGLSMGAVVRQIITRTGEKDDVSGTEAGSSAGDKIDFLDPVPIGNEMIEPPMISNIAVADLDEDGLLDIVVCDCRKNAVTWIRQYPAGTYAEHELSASVKAPAHAQVMDFDDDGDYDIMVASLGIIFPSNDKIGSVIILENEGNCKFKKHNIEEKIARVSDVRACDLDGDGDKDLAVAQFGYDDGETRWIENLGNWSFQSHILQHLSGPINVEPVDIDTDGDVDIVCLVSQEWEEIYLYKNDGKGNFKPELIYGSTNQDFGSSGIYMADIDKDGDLDILYTNGDAFDYIPPQGRPWHGVQWLENKGDLKFEFHRLGTFIGAYNARPYDIDSDGDLDLFAVSAFNLWDKPESQSFIWMENRGDMTFDVHDIASNPTHLITMEFGDFNKDGLMDAVTGGMHAYPPYDRMSRIMLWINNGNMPARN